MSQTAPTAVPKNPNFSSGPCSKRPGYDLGKIQTDVLGRSHRSSLGKERLALAIEKTKSLLNLPEGYRVGIVPGSDTGAMEMVMWSVLGQTGVDVFAWESFGSGWANDVLNQLNIEGANIYKAEYGQLPDLTKADPANDIIFTYNGTTSGVKVENLDWIADDRTGLSICDATSAVFAMDIDWNKVDVATFSWQKVLGGEGAHGMLILSPRAVKRLESYQPTWPLPKVFRLTSKGKLTEGIFKGATINTPSMLCVEDYLDALSWIESIGGVDAAIKKSQANLAVIEQFVDENEWIDFLAEVPAHRSNTSVCLSLDATAEQVKAIEKLLATKNVAYDINSYKDAPAGLRIWCGATVEASDLKALMPWLKWAYQQSV
ncbi:phosphoserine transaminase [Catenovulum sp. SM1970]|uniref:phosphoserine transaminase n=1 Tax=Marinifaba aquimaris TaxID=2741323 RepID=UPI001574BB65|nr:phosphoserine transaminase [Marinifaba aquimaris]NTS76996.1 phosphoserine transaminase [Marinifaba aquimaris]